MKYIYYWISFVQIGVLPGTGPYSSALECYTNENDDVVVCKGRTSSVTKHLLEKRDVAASASTPKTGLTTATTSQNVVDLFTSAATLSSAVTPPSTVAMTMTSQSEGQPEGYCVTKKVIKGDGAATKPIYGCDEDRLCDQHADQGNGTFDLQLKINGVTYHVMCCSVSRCNYVNKPLTFKPSPKVEKVWCFEGHLHGNKSAGDIKQVECSSNASCFSIGSLPGANEKHFIKVADYWFGCDDKKSTSGNGKIILSIPLNMSLCRGKGEECYVPETHPLNNTCVCCCKKNRCNKITDSVPLACKSKVSPTTTDGSTQMRENTALIVGLVVGGVILLALGIFSGVYIYRRTKNTGNSENLQSLIRYRRVDACTTDEDAQALL